MASFILQRDEDGVEYVNLAHNPQTKNHKNLTNDPEKENLRGFMFARPKDLLYLVASFKKYISKCSDAKSFYLRPKRASASDVWYSREAMGVHCLGNMMKKISKEVIRLHLWLIKKFLYEP